MAAKRRGTGFFRRGNEWFHGAGLPSDIIVEVDDVSFHLHRFPLMSKCGKIIHLLEGSQAKDKETYCIALNGFPGGPDVFLVATKFCYGFRVALTPKNVILVHVAAEYLEMTEDYGEDNLLVTSENFFHKNVVHNWKDCILALQCYDSAVSDVGTSRIVGKALNALSTMVCTDMSLFGWPLMMYGHLQSPGGSILWNGINTGATIRSIHSDWWFDDIACFSVPLFKGLIEKMKARGIRPERITAAIMHYARTHIPGLDRWQNRQGGKSIANLGMSLTVVDQKFLLESIEKLLPEKKGNSFCRFLLGLLRFSIILNASQSCKESLERRIGMQLELATLDGLLIPTFSDSDNLYDTDSVERIVRHFVSSDTSSCAPFSPSSFDPGASPSSSPLRKVSKLVDSYLAEIAPDVNLKPQKIRTLAEALPKSSRSYNDGLYRALDIYFKAHPWLSNSEKEKLCDIIDYQKLSIDACAHASQNDRLPLRVVLQVLFFEQLHLRASIANYLQNVDGDSNTPVAAGDVTEQIVQRDGWTTLVRENRGLKVDMEQMTLRVRELEIELTGIKQNVKRVGKSHKSISSPRLVPRNLGCMPRSSDPQSDSVGRIDPSPRKSMDQPHVHRRSSHAHQRSLSIV
ncbi:BTB/POZ domain-containing protein [Acorus gramineus]|uniref:BTB/POZ domain-containing protein n=1 Tax=Acorus gramineus TaxID=55184 RepID=A0AAV9BIW0_ACOGR|nr:BTB/POZ domain-containing protein [Acorus gramineus]